MPSGSYAAQPLSRGHPLVCRFEQGLVHDPHIFRNDFDQSSLFFQRKIPHGVDRQGHASNSRIGLPWNQWATRLTPDWTNRYSDLQGRLDAELDCLTFSSKTPSGLPGSQFMPGHDCQDSIWSRNVNLRILITILFLAVASVSVADDLDRQIELQRICHSRYSGPSLTPFCGLRFWRNCRRRCRAISTL